jgi:uncharacterized protein (DUF2249 family)
MTITPDTDRFIDVRLVPPSERHPRIFAMLESLVPGSEMTIVVDHDPVPLRRHLDANHPGLFDWHWLENGPELWRAVIERLPLTTCCGSCGGGH